MTRSQGTVDRSGWSPGWLRAPGRTTAESRYELERALHDGPTIGLSALAIELGLIRTEAEGTPVAARIDEARYTVCRMVEVLRLLGASIHPPTLVAGVEPAWSSIAEHRGLRLTLDLPDREFGAEARSRTGLLVADHLRRLDPGTAVRVRVRGRRFVRVHITEQRNSSQRRHFRAVLRCG